MDLYAAERMARSIMDTHGLYDWTFAWDRGLNRAGACHLRARKITLSRVLMPTWTEDAVRNVVLHEDAHALAPRNAGHGREWKIIARRIGCTGDRCWTPSDDAPAAAPKFLIVCASGHEVGKRHRRTDLSRYRCRLCRARLDLVPA